MLTDVHSAGVLQPAPPAVWYPGPLHASHARLLDDVLGACSPYLAWEGTIRRSASGGKAHHFRDRLERDYWPPDSSQTKFVTTEWGGTLICWQQIRHRAEPGLVNRRRQRSSTDSTHRLQRRMIVRTDDHKFQSGRHQGPKALGVGP